MVTFLARRGRRVVVFCRRRGERGAAVLVVVLVLTLLTAIGVFASRAASIGSLASGYEKQETQTHYMTEYGMVAASTQLRTNVSSSIVKGLANPLPGKTQSTCKGGVGIVDAGVPCAHITYTDIQTAGAGMNPPAPPLVEVADAGAPGSLGPSPIAGDFDVELTDPVRVDPPPPGFDSKKEVYRVALTAFGQVRAAAAGVVGQCTQQSTSTAGIESMRAYVVVPVN